MGRDEEIRANMRESRGLEKNNSREDKIAPKPKKTRAELFEERKRANFGMNLKTTKALAKSIDPKARVSSKV